MTPENRCKTGIVEAGKNTRFRQGISGNPGGRPATKLITEELMRRLAMRAPAKLAINLGLRDDATVAEAIAARLAYRAMEGDVGAIKEIVDRLEGKVRQATNVSPDEEVVLRIVYDDIPASDT